MKQQTKEGEEKEERETERSNSFPLIKSNQQVLDKVLIWYGESWSTRFPDTPLWRSETSPF